MGNISSWTEGILMMLAFVAIFGIVVAGFNIKYHKENSLGFTDNTTTQLFINYMDTAETQLQGGEVAFDAQNGISLKNSWGLAKDALKVVWSFFTGGFIENAIETWNTGEAGQALATALRIIWFLGLVFALLYALFKIVI